MIWEDPAGARSLPASCSPGGWPPGGVRQCTRRTALAMRHLACLARAQRNPTLLFRFDGSFLFRLAARTCAAVLLFHDPPRRRRAVPVVAPVGLLSSPVP